MIDPRGGSYRLNSGYFCSFQGLQYCTYLAGNTYSGLSVIKYIEIFPNLY